MHPLSLLLLLPVAISFSKNITSREGNRYEACTRTYRCGNIDIRYPFLIDDRPSYCGHPSLSLACEEGNRAEIVVGTMRYQVMNISYADGSITLVDEHVLEQDGCPTNSFHHPITSPILELTPGNGPLIVLLTGCPQRPDQNYNYSMGSSNFGDMDFHEICNETSAYSDVSKSYISYSDLGGKNYSYWAYENPSSPWTYSITWARKLGCSNVVNVSLPEMALYHLHRNQSTIRDVMKEGVEYRWRTGEGWCNASCENSGGVCGFNHSYYGEAICICPDGLPQSHLCSNVSSGFISFLLLLRS